MAQTTSVNKFIPEVHGALTVRNIENEYRRLKGSAYTTLPLLKQLLNSDSNVIVAPNWIPLSGSDELGNETRTDLAIDNIDTEKGYACKGYRVKAFGASAISTWLGMGDPLTAIERGLTEYWLGRFSLIDSSYLSSIDTLLPLDLTGQTDKTLSPANVISAIHTKGDKYRSLAEIHVHGDVQKWMRINNLFDYAPPSAQGQEVLTYQGLRVITDNSLPKVETAPSSGVYNYTSRILGNGVIGYALKTVPAWAGSEKVLLKQAEVNVSNLAYTMHVQGTTLSSTGLTAVNAAPSGLGNAALATPANFELLHPATSIPYIAVKHRLAS